MNARDLSRLERSTDPVLASEAKRERERREERKARAKADRKERAKDLGLPGKTQAQRRRSKASEDAKVYRKVVRRDRVCQVQSERFGPCSGPLHIDHQWGRGKEPTRLDNCRRLCMKHDRMKTDSEPDRIAWLEDYREWSFRAKCWPEYRKAQLAIGLERAQHPRSVEGT